MTDTKLLLSDSTEPPQTVGARKFQVDEALEFADMPSRFLTRDVSITELAVCRTLAWEVRRLQALSASGGAEAVAQYSHFSRQHGHVWHTLVATPIAPGTKVYFASHPAEPSVPQGSKVEPRKCTWGDQMGGCQGHPDDCQCVQPAVAAEPEALTAAYERGWNAGYKSGKPVPQGMVLVPVEAPDEMLAAGAKTLSLYRDDMVSDATITDNIYRAMLAASPAAPEGATGCTRSHPHELMGQHCLLLTEIERLKSEIRWVSGVCSGAVELVDCMDDTEALRRIKERLDMAAPPAHTPAEGLAAIAQDLAARQTTLGPEINTALARAGSKLYDDGGAPHTPAAGALNGVAAAIEIRDVLRGYAGELTAATSQWLNRMCVAPPPTAQPPQQTTAAIAANAMRVVVSCAEDYLNAVAALGKVKEGKTLFDHSPIKDEEAYNAWTALNDTGKRLRECVERLRPAITEEPTR